MDLSGLDFASETSQVDLDNPLVAGSKGFLDKNALTTAGVLVASGTAIAGTGLLVTVLPAQMALALGTSAGLLYAGDRQDKELPIFPWQKADEQAPAA